MAELRHLALMGVMSAGSVLAGGGLALFLLRGEIVQNPWGKGDHVMCFAYRRWERRAELTEPSMARLCEVIEGGLDHAR